MAASKPPPTDLPIHAFADAAAMDAFLAAEHQRLPGMHVKFARKASGIASITHAEAVEVALCYGWIDGQGNRFDEQYFLARFTPRRSKSLWSKKNVDSVARLAAADRIAPAGFAAIEAAKADGRWERAYAGPATIEVPSDFSQVLQGSDEAKSFFEGLNRTDRYSVLWRVHTASPSARPGRIASLVDMLAEGKVAGAAQKEKQKAKSRAKAVGAKKNEPKKVVSTKTKVESNKAPAAKSSAASAEQSDARASRRPGLRPRS